MGLPPRMSSLLRSGFFASRSPERRLLGAALVALVFVASASAAEPVSFNRDIRPIFSDSCFACHGPDEKKRDSGLRLDVREDALKMHDDILPIVPGHPEKSEVMIRLTSTDRDEVMPPPKSHKKVTPGQVETIRRWIAEGAVYEGHWAFVKPVRPTVPPLPNPDAVAHNPIDNFILARLAKEGLTQRPEADRPTLLRRAALDLTGIPPTPEEVAAFVADPDPNAYEKVIDRLLASPRYGERMATQWLDFARYADSNGFQSDTSRHMWPWRDWVINAFNDNQPFDQFTIEQLAGDLLPNPTRAQLVATGFNRNHRLNGEGGRIVEEWFTETVIDRVETTSATWLALTYNCCRCHDHKFDPILQKDFYGFSAFFNSIDESGVLDSFTGKGSSRIGGNTRPLLFLPTPSEEAKLAKLESVAQAAEQHAAAEQKRLPQLQKEWESKLARQLQEPPKSWIPLAITEARSEGGATLSRQPDGSWLATGANPDHDTYTVSAPIPPGEFTGLRVEALPDPALPHGSLGRNSNGNFVLTDVEVEITAASLPQQMRAEFTRAAADYEQKGYEVKYLVDESARKAAGQARKGWAVDGHDPAKHLARAAMLVVGTPLTVPPDATMIVRLKHDSANRQHNMGRFRIETTSLPPAAVKLQDEPIPDPIRAAILVPAAQRTPKQRDELSRFFRENTANPPSEAKTAAEEARRQASDFEKTFDSVMIMKELPAPRPAFILKRGEYDKPGDKVERRLPAFLPPLPPGAPVNRLGLAQWIVSPENPLTARVWVNRAWEKFFGIGISRSTENFGSQSEWPVHLELLDWLATEFMRLNWDMKALQKTIVMSATYRQSSKVTPELVARDPENRLLARGPRFRLPAELIRDQALAVSGLLVEKRGGPSVRPYMPKGVWDETSVYGDLRNYHPDTGPDLYRRSLYTIWKRTASPPSMTMFDSPTREICTVKRSRTDTPLQALALLNEETYVEAARVLAQRMLAEGGATPGERIAWGFQRATCRPPSPDELRILTAGLQKRLPLYQQQPQAATELASLGAAPPLPKADPAELAAYIVTANVLLNLDEVVTRE